MFLNVICAVNGIPSSCTNGICYATGGGDLCKSLGYPCGTTVVATTTVAPTTSPVCDFRCTNVGTLTANPVTCKCALITSAYDVLHVHFLDLDLFLY